MASFKLCGDRRPRRTCEKIPREEIPRIVAAAEALAVGPFPLGCEKLVGTECTYRIRIGDYRLLYEVETTAQVVEIQRVRHRKDVYRNR